MAHKTGPTTDSKPGENIYVDPSYSNSTPPAKGPIVVKPERMPDSYPGSVTKAVNEEK
jgi:hypothetical protein